MKRRVNKKPLFIAGLATLAMVSMVTWVTLNRQEETTFKAFDFRTFDRVVIADAPGCEIRSPVGELMNEAFKGKRPNTLNIEKGTSFTIDCFPLKKNEKSTVKD